MKTFEEYHFTIKHCDIKTDSVCNLPDDICTTIGFMKFLKTFDLRTNVFIEYEEKFYTLNVLIGVDGMRNVVYDHSNIDISEASYNKNETIKSFLVYLRGKENKFPTIYFTDDADNVIEINHYKVIKIKGCDALIFKE